MFNSTILEVAIGLAFVYLLLSLICSVVNEWIAGIWKLRASNLEAGIRSLFTDGTMKNAEGKVVAIADAIYGHGLIQSLSKTGEKPSYIPAKLFASALIDTLAPADASGPKSITEVRSVVEKLPDVPARQALLTVIGQAGNELNAVRTALESWYNDGMDRVAGWYKRKTQTILVVLALVVTVATNTDTVAVAKALLNSPALREAAVAAADKYVKERTSTSQEAKKPDTTIKSDSTQTQNTGQQTATDSKPATPNPGDNNPSASDDKLGLNDLRRDLAALDLPIGWKTCPKGWEGWGITLLGWILTTAAVSLGAPFWFDMLNKIMVVRSTIKPKEKSADAK